MGEGDGDGFTDGIVGVGEGGDEGFPGFGMGVGGEFLDGLEPGVAATRLQLLQRPPNHGVDRSKGSVAVANSEFAVGRRGSRGVRGELKNEACGKFGGPKEPPAMPVAPKATGPEMFKLHRHTLQSADC
jgi:hypothetical protein